MVILPVKAFGRAKERLSDTLTPDVRAQLAKRLAEVVIDAAAPFPTSVVCDDDDVAAWAESRGATVVWCPETGLNGAVERGVAHAGEHGHRQAIVAHADLPWANDFRRLSEWPGITLVPDHRNDGTPAVCLPVAADFAFDYGTGSFRRHVVAAHRSGSAVRILRSADFARDIDIAADLVDLHHHPDPTIRALLQSGERP